MLKNCMSVNEGFLILYGDPYKVFWEKNLGASSVISMGQYTRKLRDFGLFLKRGL